MASKSPQPLFNRSIDGEEYNIRWLWGWVGWENVLKQLRTAAEQPLENYLLKLEDPAVMYIDLIAML